MTGPSDRVAEPILRLSPDGNLGVSQVRFLPGTAIVPTPYGTAFDFNGDHCGLEIPDLPQYKLTSSMTVSCWIYLRSYTTSQNSAPGAQILFRGDDRSGADPFHLTILRDGTVAFSVENAEGQGAHVIAPISLLRWTHVTASFDLVKGKLSLSLDGQSVAQVTTSVKPYRDLDQGWSPGIGIGNVQRSSGGAHNQPLNGQLCDLRLYGSVVPPDQAGWRRAATKALELGCG